jgi:two-component system sensor histidine kinase PilS (NtrC family)
MPDKALPLSEQQSQRLKNLMLFRIALVTLFLGGAIFTNAQVVSDLSNPRNSLHLGLIISTYALTIVYAVVIQRVKDLTYLPHVQLVLDLLLSGTLVMTTGGLRTSVFLFTLYLPIIAGAFLISQRWAIGVAGVVSSFLFYLALVSLGLLPGPNAPVTDVLINNARTIVTEAMVNITFAFLLAWSSGQLAKQLGEAKTEIERRQGDLRELRALNENILASLNSGLMTLDLKMNIIFFNAAAEQITGRNSDDVFGAPLEMLFPNLASKVQGEDLPNFAPRLEGTYTHPDGELLYLGFSVSALRNAAGSLTGQIIIFQDLSQIKALEEQAKLSERMAAIGHLSAAIAHEIRNPLASISGSVEMLQALATLSEDEGALMGIILREVERLNDLISQFLEYSRPRQLDPTPIDIVELVSESLQLFRHSHMDILVALDVDDALEGVEILLDREAMSQVIWNLLNNAADAMVERHASTESSDRLPNIPLQLPMSTPLLSPSEVDDIDPSLPRIDVILARGEKNTDALVIIVEDNGPGISPEIADRLFEPFFTTKEKGTGLGLATIFRLIEDHGGYISITPPQRLKGARFVIELPFKSSVALLADEGSAAP